MPWQVLAGINEIETDYGRNLSVSSAGAVGWMQFLPSTWKEWGVDANGDGVADPYNPVDAIFTAARYLHAAGASSNIGRAIFAYNHACWYVESVLLRAKLIGGIPSELIGALTGLVQGHFPVAAPAKYADSSVVKLAKNKVKGANAAIAIDSNPNAKGTSIFAKKDSPVIAVNDGKIVSVGTSQQLGNYVKLQDATGNIYTYAHLGSVSKRYPVPKPVKFSSKQIIKEFSVPAAKAPTSAASAGSQVLPKVATTVSKAATKPSTSTPAITGPASAGTQTTGQAASPRPPPRRAPGTRPPRRPPAPPRARPPRRRATPARAATVTAPMVKERLFANPNRPASYAAGGNLQLKNSSQQITNFRNYFSDTLHLAKNQYTLKSLKKGAIVVAGTILGRIGGPSQGVSPHLYFTIQPAGKNAPYIDPKPILDGWKLLEATAVYRAAGVDPFFGPGAKNPSVGQVLLMSKQQLTTRVLADPHVQVYACGRRDIEAGLIDRRVLAVIEFLSASGPGPRRLGPGVRSQRDRRHRHRRRGRHRSQRRHHQDQRDPDPGPPTARLGHRHHDPPAADAAGLDAPEPDRLGHLLQGPAQHPRAARPQEPDPDHVHPGLRDQQQADQADQEHPAAGSMDSADQPHQPDPRAGRPDRAQQVRDPEKAPVRDRPSGRTCRADVICRAGERVRPPCFASCRWRCRGRSARRTGAISSAPRARAREPRATCSCSPPSGPPSAAG